MLAERFQSDFYDHIAARTMVAKDGKLTDIATLEVRTKPDKKAKRNEREEDDAGIEKWAEREWVQRWLMIEPSLGTIDLRPYVFVARDKRAIALAPEYSGLEGLIDRLCGSEMAVRGAEAQVKSLPSADAEQVFGALRERVLRHGSFTAQPPGFDGMSIVAKHHARFQKEILTLLGSIETKDLGIWVVRGWNETVTERGAIEQLRSLMTQWAAQDLNAILQKAASQALGGIRKLTG
jgi:hypothetical protein